MNHLKKRIKYLAASLIAILAIFFVYAFISSSTNFGRTVPVLMYHNIEKVPGGVWSVSTEEFRRQMSALKEQGYRSVLPGDLKGGLFRKLPPKPIIITFDDGFLGCMTEAEPILKSVGFRAICYVILTNVAEAGQDRVLYREQECLRWDDIRDMHQRETFIFGVHSYGHTPDKGQEAAELWQCRYLFKQKAGFKPEHYCYPYGGAPDVVANEVKRRKYKTAMVCDDKLFTIDRNTDWFRIPRVSVFGGIHDFSVVPSASVENGIYTATIANAGKALPVKAVLRSKTGGQSWSTPVFRKCAADAIDCRWEGILEGLTAQDLTVEIWEQNGLFRYYP